MRTKLVLMLGVSFAALALLVSTAKAVLPADRFGQPAVMPPGSAYPWVQPVWQTVNGVVIVTLPQTIATANTQPPAWVLH